MAVRERVQPVEGGWTREVEVSGVPANLSPALLESPPARGSTEEAPGTFRWSVDATRVRLRVEGASPAPTGLANTRAFKLTARGDGRFTGRVRPTVGATD